MFNFPRRPALTRAGIGAVLVALVAIAGYNIGLAQSPGAVVSAAQSVVRTSDTPHLKGSDTTTSYAPVVDAVAPAVVTVRVEKKASVVPTQFPGDDDLFRFFGRQFQLPRQPPMMLDRYRRCESSACLQSRRLRTSVLRRLAQT